MRVNLKLIQVVSDALIPVLGFFLWGWGLFFILLYYLIDLLVSELFMYIKTRAIQLKQGGHVLQTVWYIVLGQLLIVSSLLLVRIFILNAHPELDLRQEIIAFWRYKDLGIQQGYILIPLVFFVGFQRYKTEFLRPRKNETESISVIWQRRLKSLVLLLTCVGFMAGLTHFIVFPDWVYLVLLLGTSSIFQLVR
jgi:hypothetical protein